MRGAWSGARSRCSIAWDRDDIVGILLAKALLRLTTASARERFDIREYMRPAVFVPESKRLNVLLKEFRRNRNHMAIVVDEYGGVSGLCTIEDVIEQIVGEIDDEFDVEDDQNIRRDAEAQFTVRGVTRIAEFNEYFGARLSEAEGVDTVAGLLMKELGRLPRRGESASIGGFEFRVLRAHLRRRHLLAVRQHPRPRPGARVARPVPAAGAGAGHGPVSGGARVRGGALAAAERRGALAGRAAGELAPHRVVARLVPVGVCVA